MAEDDENTEYLSRTSEDKILKRRGYNLTTLLGEGSYAKVYLANYSGVDERNPNHVNKSQTLACKVVDGNAAPKDFLKRFFPREIEIMSRVNHQYLIRVHSILQRKNKYFLFMQYCENGDVLEFIRKQGAIKEKQARVWFCEMLQGLNYLHDRNIAHRDLKCENILLTHKYNIKISDFGFARYMLPNDGKSETFCGSVSYAAPEIIRGNPYEPKATDIWSTGVILFVMLNKAMPFDDTSLKLLYDSQLARNWKFRTKVKDILSSEVKTFLYNVMNPDVATRWKISDLWDDEWIQAGSTIDLKLARPSRLKIDKSKVSKRELEIRERRESERLERDLKLQTEPIHILEIDTNKVRHASYFFPSDGKEKDDDPPSKSERRVSKAASKAPKPSNKGKDGSTMIPQADKSQVRFSSSRYERDKANGKTWSSGSN